MSIELVRYIIAQKLINNVQLIFFYAILIILLCIIVDSRSVVNSPFNAIF